MRDIWDSYHSLRWGKGGGLTMGYNQLSNILDYGTLHVYAPDPTVPSHTRWYRAVRPLLPAWLNVLLIPLLIQGVAYFDKVFHRVSVSLTSRLCATLAMSCKLSNTKKHKHTPTSQSFCLPVTEAPRKTACQVTLNIKYNEVRAII